MGKFTIRVVDQHEYNDQPEPDFYTRIPPGLVVIALIVLIVILSNALGWPR